MTSKQTSAKGTENRHLMSLLAALLAAVSQQFIHILLLHKHGEVDLVTRFREIDDNDFKNAMQIIDLLTSRGVSIEIDNHVVAPGLSTLSILRSEHKMELHLQEIIQGSRVSSPDGKSRLSRASLLRENYRSWLTKQIGSHRVISCRSQERAEKPELFSLLLLSMEQTLVHAFYNWHEGDTDGADTAWQMSGAAMLYLTALANFCGSDSSDLNSIAIPRSTLGETADRFQSDINLVRECAMAAQRLERQTDDQTLGELCKRIAADCDSIARTQRGASIKAGLGNSKVFREFGRARDRMNS